MMTNKNPPARRWRFVSKPAAAAAATSIFLLLLLSSFIMGIASVSAASATTTVKSASFWTDHPDRVKILPGYTPGAPPVTILSGYLHYEFQGEQVHTHYMLFKAEEAFFADGEEPPLIYWSS